ncbi:uncharacterized protein LOC141705285 [Apium graveolens]|uniref:uncharacterized protein LOC141705285 n=1 Tax=Apium graveolens TaxID=4045 RepID=UPI003D7AEF64
MSNKNFEGLRNIHKGRSDWTIKVRFVREWRGVTNAGVVFKSCNYIVLDNKNCRMQVFVPAALVEKMSRLIVQGNAYFINNFQLKEYTNADKYRAVQMDKQIVFTADTKVKDVDDKLFFIPNNSFDLFDYGDLKAMTKQVLYFTDVIGILETLPTISRIPNKQVKIKFKITDGK